MVLDEPTEGLDPLVQETFFALLGEAAAAGRTVLLSSHILPEVQRACERVAIIRDGRLVTVQSVAGLREARARRIRLSFADGQGAPPPWRRRTLGPSLAGGPIGAARTAELVMVRPVSRTRLLVERTAALVLAALALNLAATLTVAVGVVLSPDIHRAVPLGGVFAAGVMGLGFALCLIGPAMAVSAAGRRRAQAMGATIAISCLCDQ
ncbi:hypothetical protein [Streptomyces sp. NPDC001903]|uniref:hypothetical protein n=1 Tax=Streptomyces sp. NPDC001903 TaxID=3364622 RepID=UPI003692AC3E